LQPLGQEGDRLRRGHHAPDRPISRHAIGAANVDPQSFEIIRREILHDGLAVRAKPRQVPYQPRVVPAAGSNDPAVGRTGQRKDKVAVTGKAATLLTAGQFPQNNGVGYGSDQSLVVRRNTDSPDIETSYAKLTGFSSMGKVPKG